MLRWLVVWTVVLLCAACRRSTQTPPASPVDPAPAGPSVSTTPNRSPALATTDEEGATEDWRAVADQDAGGISDARSAAPGDLATSDTLDELEQRAKAAQRTQERVTAALDTRKKALVQCFERASLPTSKVSLSLRMHHTGRVLSADFSGAPAVVQSCLRAALDGMRVDGVETGTTTIQRTLTFTSVSK